jgi:hypothetical protein
MCAHQLSATDRYLAPVRKIHSLRQADIEVVAVELHRLSNGWGMDRHDDCDGDVMLLLTPHEAEISAAAFVLTRTASGIQLARAEGEDYEFIDSFVTVAAAIQRLFSAIADSAERPSITVAV